MHQAIKIFNTWDTQEDSIHVVQTDRSIPRNCLYAMTQELEVKNKASTYILFPLRLRIYPSSGKICNVCQDSDDSYC